MLCAIYPGFSPLAPRALTLNPSSTVSLCGLRISDNSASDNLAPQETTKRDALEVGVDGSRLHCPDSSMVAYQDSEEGFREWGPSDKEPYYDGPLLARLSRSSFLLFRVRPHDIIAP